MIKSFNEFINEAKLFIYHKKFKVYNLLQSDIYKKSQIKKWMKDYNFDDWAHCVFVTKNKSSIDVSKNKLVTKANFDIKNAIYFNSDVEKHKGYMIEDSKLTLGDDDVYLYVFKKNSNHENRARQIHGFIYEGEVKKLNGLAKLGKTHKWDAEGGLDKNYLTYRLEQGKNVELFDGSKYTTLILKDDVTGFKEINWSGTINNQKISPLFNEDFSAFRNWSIKCMKKNTDIEMGDFKRISGLELTNGELKLKGTNEEYFMLAVGIHDGTQQKNILEEYIILMPIESWKTYLPDVELKLKDFQSMYTELQTHRLKGERSEEGESAWWSFINKYKKLTESSVIKLRFKRDSKGQLRIQSSISSSDFMSKILKNQHIRIN
jgi:hypothetical protein